MLIFCSMMIGMQIDGVSMGSPVAPALANIFMNHIENRISEFTGAKPIYYKRYVDDIFLIFEFKEQIESFHTYMNNLHPNIVFTTEEEEANQLPFLDVLVFRHSGRYFTTQYFKPTDTGLYLTPSSMCDDKYKNGLVQTLISRTWELNSTFELAVEGINNMQTRLKRNGYSENFICRNINKVISKKFQTRSSEEVKEEEDDQQRERCILKIQYGNGNKELRTALRAITPTDSPPIQVVFETKKIKSFLTNKCRTPKESNANLVYRFKCHGCEASYVGETKRHLRTRVAEHRQQSRESAIRDHALMCNTRSTPIKIDEFETIKTNFPSKLQRRFYESVTISASKIQLLNVKSKKKAEQLNLFIL